MVKIKYLIIITLLISCFSITANSTDINLTDIAVYANATVYNNPAFDSVGLVEFPFVLNRNNFEFYKPDSTDSRYFARIFAHVELLDVYGYPIDSTNTLFTVAAESLEDSKANDMRLFNKLSLVVKPGIYSARVIVIDVVSKNKGEFFIDNIVVEQSSKSNSVNLSGLNSVYSASYVGNDTSLINPLIYKNGYNLLINPISVFAEEDKSLFLYGEIYNLEYSDDSRTKYQLLINALDKDKNIYQMFGSRLSKKPGSSAAFVESIDIAGWNKGNYSIEVIVVDLATKLADTSYLPISIISPKEVLLEAEKLADFADPYNALTLKQKLQLAKFILTFEEEKTLNNLGDMGKENFLKAIWAEQDPTPNNNKNEFREEILTRYFYANERFSTNLSSNNGWNSDRGRVLMQYGKWDQRVDKEDSNAGIPFIVWNYFSLKGGGLTFIFADLHGDYAYRLVHSNAEGEIYSKKWADWIITGVLEIMQRD